VKEREYLVNAGVDGRLTLKWSLMKHGIITKADYERFRGKFQSRAILNAAMGDR
jgi:hypothetical protein